MSRKPYTLNQLNALAEILDDIDLAQVPVTITGTRTNDAPWLGTKERAAVIRAAFKSLGIGKHFSVRTSDYSWVSIGTPYHDWKTASDGEQCRMAYDIIEDIKQRVEEIVQVALPNVRNTCDPMTDYFDIKYSIN